MSNLADRYRTMTVQSLGDPWLTAQQAQIVLTLYAEPEGPLDAYDIEEALDGKFDRENPLSLVKVQISRIRMRFTSPSILTQWGKGYELSPAFRSQIDTALDGCGNVLAEAAAREKGDGVEAERLAITTQLTHTRLTEQYGPQRAQAILVGADEATNADLAKWRNLGSRP